MPTRRELRERFATRVVPLHVPRKGKRTEPFIVVYDTGDAYQAGSRLGIDAFHDILDDYDAVMVHWHPESGGKDRYLLYGAAREEVDAHDVEGSGARTRSVEVVGDFPWYDHGRHLAVDLSIGFHCLDEKTFEQLP